jgi:hypothetical protein
MKAILLILTTVVGVVAPLLPAQAAGKVAGYQYATFPDGEAPLEDNLIHYIPCEPDTNDCAQLQEAISAELLKAQQEMKTARSTLENPVEAWTVFTQLDQKLLPMLSQKSGYQTVTTQNKGLFSFTCPTETCLIYSYGVIRDRYGYWVTITEGRKRLDLGPAKAIAESKPRNF